MWPTEQLVSGGKSLRWESEEAPVILTKPVGEVIYYIHLHAPE